MKTGKLILCLTMLFSASVLVQAEDCCTYEVEDEILASVTSKICELSCSQCTDECCCRDNCATQPPIKCSSTTKKKRTLTLSGGGSLTMGFWSIKLELESGWETEEITIAEVSAACSTCTAYEIWNGYKEAKTRYTATWQSCDITTCDHRDWWVGPCIWAHDTSYCEEKVKSMAGTADAVDCDDYTPPQ